VVRVLQVFGKTNKGGSETMVMNYFRKIDKEKVSFDFVNHTNEKCQYDDEIQALGGIIFHMPRYNVVNTISYIIKWVRLLKKHSEYNIIHIHNFKVAFIVSLAAKIAHKRTIIIHSHSSAMGTFRFRNVFFAIIKPINNIFATDKFACSINAGRYLFGNSNFVIVCNAVDLSTLVFSQNERIRVRQALGLSSEKAFIHIGRLTKAKNHNFLLEVFALYNKSHKEDKLFIIGGGELEGDIRKRIKELDIEESVIMLGVKSDIGKWLSAMDCMLFPSLWEGLPVSIVEAQTNGIPILASDTITKEVNITPLVINIPLDHKLWVTKMEEITFTNDRNIYFDDIKRSNYNIEKASQWLQNYYLSK
jgi:glycosyltransferase involved in cell wall biosynthesis